MVFAGLSVGMADTTKYAAETLKVAKIHLIMRGAVSRRFLEQRQ